MDLKTCLPAESSGQGLERGGLAVGQKQAGQRRPEMPEPAEQAAPAGVGREAVDLLDPGAEGMTLSEDPDVVLLSRIWRPRVPAAW